MWRTLFLVCLIAMLAIFVCGCGGGTRVAPPALSITTTTLPDWMATFAYTQTLQATGGVSPFSWSVSSGNLPHGLTLANSSSHSAMITGTPDVAATTTFTIQVTDAKSQTATQSYSIQIKSLVSAQLLPVQGQVAPGTIEIQGLSAGLFNPIEWQQNTLNWLPDVRSPMLAPLPGAWQNIYSPWPLEQADGWRLFYGGWDGTDTPNDRVYSLTTPDFLSFGTHTLVIDHGQFQHVNNVNVTQLPDGSMHMICTVFPDQFGNDKPAYFSSPDGVAWNGTPEPHPAQLSDVVSVPNDPNYSGWDFNGGNVLLWDRSAWTLYYSVGIYGGIGQVYRATSIAPPVFQRTGVALNTLHYADDVKQFAVGGKTWYLMSLYIERVATDPNPPSFSYSLSNDGVQFGPEQALFGGAYPEDQFLVTPAFVTSGNSILGVLYGANPTDLLSATDQIFARWLQKKVLVTDSSGTNQAVQGAYGPDRQWLQTTTGTFQGTIAVYAEDGVTPLGTGPVNLSAGTAYQLVLTSTGQ